MSLDQLLETCGLVRGQATPTMSSVREARKLQQQHDILTGKVLCSDLSPNGNSPRMSSLHDLVKNRPFIPRYEVQTSFFLSKDIPHLDTNGGAERDRTADPLLAKQVLSQLSYSPISW